MADLATFSKKEKSENLVSFSDQVLSVLAKTIPNGDRLGSELSDR
jgi:hypothetical protein